MIRQWTSHYIFLSLDLLLLLNIQQVIIVVCQLLSTALRRMILRIGKLADPYMLNRLNEIITILIVLNFKFRCIHHWSMLHYWLIWNVQIWLLAVIIPSLCTIFNISRFLSLSAFCHRHQYKLQNFFFWLFINRIFFLSICICVNLHILHLLTLRYISLFNRSIINNAPKWLLYIGLHFRLGRWFIVKTTNLLRRVYVCLFMYIIIKSKLLSCVMWWKISFVLMLRVYLQIMRCFMSFARRAKCIFEWGRTYSNVTFSIFVALFWLRCLHKRFLLFHWCWFMYRFVIIFSIIRTNTVVTFLPI